MPIVDPSLPFAAKVEEEFARSRVLSFPAKYREDLLAYAGPDPMSGKLIPDTTIEWDLATEVQKDIFQYYLEKSVNVPAAGFAAIQAPPNFEQLLRDNAGPNEPDNFSYADWGLVPGKPANPELHFARVMDPRSGLVSAGIVIP